VSGGLLAGIVVLLASPEAATRAPAPARDAKVDAAVQKLAPAIVEARQRIHQNPELGNRETKTAELIAAHLRALGLEPRTGLAHTGVVANLKGGRPGPYIAVRADMDALPVTEDTPFPFKSTVRATYLGQEVGVSHACGHDIHVAVQMGVVAILAAMKAELPGEIQFIFQPAEEGPPPGEKGGAALMLEEGLWKERKPQAVFGLHASAQDDVGTITYCSGPAMAAADALDVTIKGRQAHGARPELAIDPVVIASQAVMALQTIHSRNVPPRAPTVLTIGMIRGGQRRNIIPAEVEMQGTVRTYDPKVQDLVERRIREVLDGVTKAGGATFDMTYLRQYPVTINDPALTKASLPSLARAAKVAEGEPRTGSEDFSYFSNETPGFFYFLGVRKPGGASGDHHTPTFTADDGAVAVGMRAMSYLLLDYLARESVRVPPPGVRR
jgi:amidohydrolase